MRAQQKDGAVVYVASDGSEHESEANAKNKEYYNIIVRNLREVWRADITPEEVSTWIWANRHMLVMMTKKSDRMVA
jgi:hypothetical protein